MSHEKIKWGRFIYTDIDGCPRYMIKLKNKLQNPMECSTISSANCLLSILFSVITLFLGCTEFTFGSL